MACISKRHTTVDHFCGYSWSSDPTQSYEKVKRTQNEPELHKYPEEGIYCEVFKTNVGLILDDTVCMLFRRCI